jgi:hypothetical protein
MNELKRETVIAFAFITASLLYLFFLAGSHFHLESALHPKPGSIVVLGYKDQVDAIQSSNLLRRLSVHQICIWMGC